MGLVYDTTTPHIYIQTQKYICIFYCIRMRRSWQPEPEPTQTKRNFVRTGAKRGEVVYEQPPTGSYSHPFTGYTGVAADHVRRHAENKPKRATQSNAQERARQKYEQQQEEARERYREEQERARRWYEQQQQKSQSPKQRSKSPSKKRSASPTSPEPPEGEGIKRDTGSPPSNCPSFKKYPVRPTGDKKTKKIQLRKQLLLFHSDKNTGCSEAATEKMKLLNKYKDQDPMLAGGKSKRKSKRASKRTTKKRSGK